MNPRHRARRRSATRHGTTIGGRTASLAPQTIVSFHAHPDDEALLTGGTLAMLAAAGHRVVLVVATSGGAGLSAPDVSAANLARRRVAEVEQSAARLGCARVVHLGYPDSGWSGARPDPAAPDPAAPRARARGSVPFAQVDVAEAAARLAAILVEESADVLTVYDRRGGYGHPDHVQVHDVGVAAARRAGTARVLEATLDRTMLRRGVRVLRALRLVPAGTPVQDVDSWYSGRPEITHRVPVRNFTDAKRAALACHRSQTQGGDGPRTVRLLLALPGPAFRLVCGTEWFIETGASVPVRPEADPLAAARAQTLAAVRAVAGPSAAVRTA